MLMSKLLFHTTTILSLLLVVINQGNAFLPNTPLTAQRTVMVRSNTIKNHQSHSYRYRSPSELRETNEPDYETEETLLKLHLAVLPGTSVDNAKQAVGKYCQSFPFAAVLPVQPLQYLPTDDGGVEVKFLRKKTDIKSCIDGGICFFVEADEDGGIDVTAKRNSKGQTIQKIMAERLVVTAFVSGITGEETDKYGQAPTNLVRVTSLYHKWM